MNIVHKSIEYSILIYHMNIKESKRIKRYKLKTQYKNYYSQRIQDKVRLKKRINMLNKNKQIINKTINYKFCTKLYNK
jgi:hypothetical protein